MKTSNNNAGKMYRVPRDRTPITGSSLLHVASYYGKTGMVKELVNVHGLSLVSEEVQFSVY